MNTLLKRLATALVAIVVSWVVWSFLASPIVPVVWEAPANPGLSGVFASNKQLANVDTVAMPDLGPEDIACSSEGWLYSGLEDGQIVRFKDQGEATLFARTEGRPLGMIFDQQGALIVADAAVGAVP